MTPTVRRQTVGELCASHEGLSERKVCKVLGWSRTSVRYRAAANPVPKARETLQRCALEHPSWGYRRLWRKLRSQLGGLGRRRFMRLYRDLRLERKRNPRRRPVPRSEPANLPRATAPRQSYAMDFMHHMTTTGMHFRVLVVVDEFTRELLALRVERSFTSRATNVVLSDVFAEYGTPVQVRCDNGPEFISETTQEWLKSHGVTPQLSRPGKPCDNGLCESTNGKIRDELLNPVLFKSLSDAQEAAAEYRHHYNDERPHSALKYRTPTAYFASLNKPTNVQPGQEM
jgi:putative transposase